MISNRALAPRMIRRQAELAALEAHLQAALAGEGVATVLPIAAHRRAIQRVAPTKLKGGPDAA